MTELDDEPQIDLQEIINEMSELGRALFDAALERVQKRKLAEHVVELRARITELEGQRAGDKDAMRGVPNGRKIESAVDLAKAQRQAGGMHG